MHDGAADEAVTAGRQSLPGSLTIGTWAGDRAEVRRLFELAEDSAALLDAYLDDGTVLVTRLGQLLVGHLQLVDLPAPGEGGPAEVEVKNMAVLPQFQGQGVGRALLAEAVRRAAAAGRSRMLVATAAADIGNLRFYQREGFRMLCVERDAFTPATGYPDPVNIDGILLRDRVWLDRDLRA